MRSIALLCALVFALSGCERFSGEQGPEARARAKARDAEALAEAKDYQRAVEAYEEAIRMHPPLADAHFKAAVIYDKKLDQFLPAIYHYDAFLKLEPQSEKSKLASEFLNNAQFQYIASLPQFKTLANPDPARNQAENEALRRQITDLKAELVRLRSDKGTAVLAQPPVAAPAAAPPREKPKPVAAAPAAARPKLYRVQKGDGLQAIAQKMYGDRKRWQDILEANPQLEGPEDLKPGQTLRIP